MSLTEVMQELASAFEASSGQRVVLNFAGSNVLARQIVNGAPVDMFVSADAAQMDVVERAGMIAAGTRTPLVGNQLAVVVRRERFRLMSVETLADRSIQRIAIGDPEAVPAGVYTKQYLERIGLWQRLQGRFLPSANVRAALAAVENGSADVGIVYATDVRASPDLTVSISITGPDAPQIVYPGCIVASSKRSEAAMRFMKFLQTSTAAQIFRQYGFLPLASAP